ncbi:MAG: lamin tail domain-containing protein [Bacteroidia bacterium]|nr:lamin tail domain-containing protein [Bacteroidia bacterium]
MSLFGLLCLLWAQVFDDFSDGDFTATPPWNGTNAYWSVTHDGRLRSNGPSASATLYLSTPNSLISNTEWRFWVRVGFNPSSSNFVRIYLVSDRADLTDPALNGYYLRLGGIPGNMDSLELFRQQGSTHTRLAGGKAGRFGSTNNIMWIRVLRSSSGTWTVYADSSGFWETELSTTDASISTTSHFGIFFQHTSSNRQNLWLDDFYIGPPIVDNTPPTLLSAEVVSPTLVRLTFSEAVDITSSQNPSNYLLTPGSIAVSTANRTFPSKVELTLSAALTPSVVYTLSYSGIQDLAGNAGSGDTTIVLPEIPQLGDLIFSEIMPKPTPVVGLPPYEYVEIYNRSNKWLSTAGLRLCDRSQCGNLPTSILPPYSTLLLIPSSAATAYPNALVASPWPSLNDSGDSLSLLNAADEPLDIVKYTPSWYRDPAKALGGWSLERIDLNDLCNTDSNWTASSHPSGGTPNAPNTALGSWSDLTPPRLSSWEVLSPTLLLLSFSEPLDTVAMQNLHRYTLTGSSITAVSVQPTEISLHLSPPLTHGTAYILKVVSTDCRGNTDTISLTFGVPQPAAPGDLIFSEIMPKPTPVVGLPPYEYVEIYNRSNKWISLEGWRFCDGSRCATIFSSKMLSPGEYAILTTTSGAPALSGIGLTSFPTLNDSEDSLSLRNADDILIDQVSYSSSWYRDEIKSLGGWSLERIDMNDLCSTDSNWIATTNPQGGTPNAPNSVQGIWRDTIAPRVVHVSFISAQRLLLHFSERIDTAFMREVNHYAFQSGPIITSAQIWGLQEVELLLSAPLLPSREYVLEIQARDCMGNFTLINYALGLPEPALPFDIVITEIMADPTPSVGLPPYEYIEIFNRSNKYIALEGWRLQVGNNQTILPRYLIRPGNYLVLTSSEGASALASLGPTIGMRNFPSLTNDGATIRLSDPAGQLIERVSYSSRWYDDPDKDEGGWSLERIWTDWLCGGSNGWRASAAPSGGTPGSPNSVQSAASPPSPQIMSISYEFPHVIVLFSERMDSAALSDVLHYRFTPAVNVLAATPIQESFGVELLLSDSLERNKTYLLTISPLLNCSGSSIDSLSASLVVPGLPEPWDIVINEILPEPQTGGVRYVELYNRSTKVLSVDDLLLARGANPRSFQRVGAGKVGLIPPQSYLCLTPDTEDVKGRYFPPPYSRFYQIGRIPTFDYRVDTVWLLRRIDSLPIDRVPYSADYHFPDLRTRKGVALERLSVDASSDDPQNWYSAASVVRYGTPGYENSQRAPVENTAGIRVEPRTFSPDGDGYEDVLWVFVPTQVAGVKADIHIHTLRGYPVCTLTEGTTLAVGENTFRWEGTDTQGRRLPAGIYVVSLTLTEPDRGKVRRYRLLCAIAEKVK